MDIYGKYGVDKNISKADFLEILDERKQRVLRKLNNVFDNPNKERELKRELDEIEAAELIIKNDASTDSTTGLLKDELETSGTSTSANEKKEDEAVRLYNLGIEFQEKEEYSLALSYYEKAANLGNADAQYQVGYYYHAGYGDTPKDKDRALFWYTKAAEQGDVKALNNLGNMYRIEDRTKACECYNKAAEGGNPTAMYNLGDIHYRYNEPYLAYKWYCKYWENVSDAYEKNRMLGELRKVIEYFTRHYVSEFSTGPQKPLPEEHDILLKAKQSYENKITELYELLEITPNEGKPFIEETIEIIKVRLIEIKDRITKVVEAMEATQKKPNNKGCSVNIVVIITIIFIIWKLINYLL